MKKPTLLVMAAGMGSRFGGLKQMTPVDAQGNSIIHYSIYDAIRAGFGKVVFIIKKAIEADFRALMQRVEPHIEVAYVFQENDRLPQGYCVPEGREKPWGTGHAVLCAKDEIDGPFAVINSDDFYGRGSFDVLSEFLKTEPTDDLFSMVGFRLRNAMTDSGHVARGVCEAENGFLSAIHERTHIEKRGEDAVYTEDGETFLPLSGQSIVSMNFWCCSPLLLTELERRFPKYLDKYLPQNPLKCEFFLPTVIDSMIHEGMVRVRVLESSERWYGVTYREDLATVQNAISEMHRNGLYPDNLF